MLSAPVQPQQRIQYLDVVRGLAITGVLFAYVAWNLGNEPLSSYTTLDKVIDEVGSFLIDSKCYTLLACLFSVGFVLHMNKTDDQQKGLVTYRRRLLGLLIIGWLHASLLRNGDILAPYAILTFFVTFMYRSSNRAIIAAMIVTFLLEVLVPLAWSWWKLPMLQRPVGIPNSYWADNFAWVKYWYATSIFFWETTFFLLLAGLLLGRTFIERKLKLGNRQLIAVAAIGFLVGSAAYSLIRFYSRQIANLPDIGNSFVIRSTVYELINLLHKLGLASSYASILFLLVKNFRLTILANLGRTSLTNYILQAAIVVPFCLVFNLFDHITPIIAFGMTAVIWIAQVLLSHWWLKHHRFGPMEWILRRFTYGRTISQNKENDQSNWVPVVVGIEK